MNFQSWKKTKRNPKGIYIDYLKPLVIWYLEKRAKKNLVIKQKRKAYAEILLQKLPELAEKIQDYNNKYSKSFQAKHDDVVWTSTGNVVDGSAW